MSCSEHYAMLISRLVDEELSPEEERALREHIRTCRRCRALLREFELQRQVFVEALEAGADLAHAHPAPQAVVKPNGKKKRKAPRSTVAEIVRRRAERRARRPSRLFVAAALALVIMCLALAMWWIPMLRAYIAIAERGGEYVVQRLQAPRDLAWAEMVAARAENGFSLGEAVRFQFGLRRRATVCFVWNGALERLLVARGKRWVVAGWPAREGRVILALVDTPLRLGEGEAEPGRYALCLRVAADGAVREGVEVCPLRQGAVGEAVLVLARPPQSGWPRQLSALVAPQVTTKSRVPQFVVDAQCSPEEGAVLRFAVASLLPTQVGGEAGAPAEVNWRCPPICAELKFARS